MQNLIQNLDCLHDDISSKYEKISDNRKFVFYAPIIVEIYGEKNDSFIIKKEKITKFLYVKDDVRVYFSDADILMMLLQIKRKHTIDVLIEELKKLYFDEGETYEIIFRDDSYSLKGIKEIEDKQILTNPQDIDITFTELLILINLIIAKDMMSVPLWPDKPNFVKHTISKYILLLQYYYNQDEKSEAFLKNIGFDVEVDIYSNYDTKEKRDTKLNIFCDFDLFEKSGII